MDWLTEEQMTALFAPFPVPWDEIESCYIGVVHSGLSNEEWTPELELLCCESIAAEMRLAHALGADVKALASEVEQHVEVYRATGSADALADALLAVSAAISAQAVQHGNLRAMSESYNRRHEASFKRLRERARKDKGAKTHD